MSYSERRQCGLPIGMRYDESDDFINYKPRVGKNFQIDDSMLPVPRMRRPKAIDRIPAERVSAAELEKPVEMPVDVEAMETS